MPSLPIISGLELIKYLSKNGFETKRQRGSHTFMVHSDGRRTTVPLHSELDRGTLKGILIQVNLLEQFIQDYRR